MILQTNFVHKVNSVLPLAPSPVPSTATGLAVRVAAQGTDILGTLTALNAAATPTWTLKNAPSWIALSQDSTGLVCTLTFSSAAYQQDPYEFYIQCSDGTSTVFFPIFLEVRPTFSIAAVTGSNAAVLDSRTLNIQSYDSTVSDIVIQGLGLNGTVLGNVKFILPSSLPSGLNFVTSDEGQLVLRVNDATLTDIAGGLKLYSTAPTAVSFAISAYQPTAFYDTPARAFTQVFSLGSNAAKAGTLDIAMGSAYDINNGVLHVEAIVDSLGGALQANGSLVALPLKYQWATTGALTASNEGNVGGVTTNKTATYSITGSGAASVTLTVQDANGSTLVNGIKTINFNQLAASNSSWTSTPAVKLSLDNYTVQGFAGSSVPVKVSTPLAEINAGETITITLNVEAESALESALTLPILSKSTITLNGTTTAFDTVNLTFPANAKVGYRWVIKMTAVSGTRSGYVQAIYECNGPRPLLVNGVTTTIAASTGVALPQFVLTATDNDPLSPTFGTPISNVSYALVGGVNEFGNGVLGAPGGISIQQGVLTGTPLVAGTYKFVVAATATGYARSYSSVITLSVAVAKTPLQISNPNSQFTQIQDNTSFAATWGYTGDASSVFLAQMPSTTPVRLVTGATSASVQQVGTNVYSIYGSSYYGNAYSTPFVVTSSSIQALQRLLPAPTTAIIDDTDALTMFWSPFKVDGAYTVYAGWDIFLTKGGVTEKVTKSGTLQTGETDDTRTFSRQLSTGDYALDMVARSNDVSEALDSNNWDSPHTFPAEISASSFTLSNTTLLKGQTIGVTLNQTYSGADSWRILFSDINKKGLLSSNEPWLPLTTRTIAKGLTLAGDQPVIIQTQRTFDTANPPVSLIRQYTVNVFVMDLDFNPSAAQDAALTGTLGLGGTQGFEITEVDATTTPEPYAVIVRALARDTITNELKLIVATSRFSNASSLLGTMAIDAFPLPGRPHAKELIAPSTLLQATSSTSAFPVKIVTEALPPTCFVGKPITEFQMQPNNNTQQDSESGVPPYRWFADGLPPGLKMSIDGTITGTPTALGTYNVTFAVMDSSTPAYIDETTLPFTIPTDLTVSTTALPNAKVGADYLDLSNPNVPTPFQLQCSGGLVPYTWEKVGGELPLGLSIDPTTGIISGVPCTYNSTTDFSKTYTVTVQVTDAIGAKASKRFGITLAPATLQFGFLNQPVVVSGEAFKLAVPVFGGQSPYTLVSFSDNGVVGSGLQIANPVQVSAIAGVTPASLTITTLSQTVYVQQYPTNIVVNLSATGGVPSSAGLPVGQGYKFLVDATGTSTLAGAVVYGSFLIASPSADGNYTVALKVIDSVGHIATKTLNIGVQRLNTGTYTVAPFILNTNGSPTNPSAWSWTALTGLPDATKLTAYTPGVNKYYALVLMNAGTRQLDNGNNPAIVPVVNGNLPPGITYASANAIFGVTSASGVVILQGTPTTNGGYSFDILLQGIGGTTATAAARQSVTVADSATGTSTVVAITSTSEFDVDLNTLTANAVNSAYAWVYPLIAEGGTAPYSFTFLTGTSVPNISQITLNNLPAFVAPNPAPGNYQVVVQATDAVGHVSAPLTIPVNIYQSITQPTRILTSALPTYLYANRAIPANTFSVTSDLVCNWSATGLPSGVSLTTAPSNTVYLSGTPTTAGTSTITITATSAVYGTSDSKQLTLEIRAQSATMRSLLAVGTPATVGTAYTVVGNNAILAVDYVGFQPGDSNLPVLVTSGTTGATIGAPNLLVNGQVTTQTSNTTPDGFTMVFNYTATTPGTDTVQLKQGTTTLQTLSLTATYPQLVVEGATVSQNVSHVFTTQSFNPPIQSITGGHPPYTISIGGNIRGDSRFTVTNDGTANAQLVINPTQFSVGEVVTVDIAMTISDNGGQSVPVVGRLIVTITQ